MDLLRDKRCAFIVHVVILKNNNNKTRGAGDKAKMKAVLNLCQCKREG